MVLSGGCLPRGNGCITPQTQRQTPHPDPYTHTPLDPEADTPRPTTCWDTHNPLPIACWDTPQPWTEFLTHACENTTFLQLLLRAVIIKINRHLALLIELAQLA